ncbi:protein RRP6-like 2 isoform X1 [Senna tora]|uniref:Protein RRP6-like 2 isoform X1 n=1 Tax=Senna tora TaxID=362788 RepID=A0A834SE93_9FABA|nr:protein RRP6-like 2 isoform X1 [Senna tora]
MPMDIDDAYDWLVNVNDEVFERFDVSADEFKMIRKKEEETGRPIGSLADSEDGFQLVYGKKKKGASHREAGKAEELDSTPASGVKVATKDKKTTGSKPKIPFHIPTIKRPQDEYKILVNNSKEQPFQHAWLDRSDDGQRLIHPLEKLSVLDFVDKDLGNLEPIKPPAIECTPFKLVEDVKGLKELAAKLRAVNEFAVDLEHNQYRSFQGLTCLMQISTRTEDFVVDTLKLRIHVGPYLREVFKDPSKKKVMHGADRDIVWLQRDFGIYICNLFDTGQASRVLKLERNSLEYLLRHFCEVTANKEYQNADWRLRPLPDEMIRYGREDTHYLLYIYDLMRIKLFELSKEADSSDTPLLEVYKRSYDICMQLYEKEQLTENSYLHIYGLQGAGFNAQQLAIVSGLCEWRDGVARLADESTGYVLPNKTLLDIAKQMPVTTNKLRRLLKSKLPYVERNLDGVVNIVRNSMQNASAFQAAAQQLKEGRLATGSDHVMPSKDGSDASHPDSPNLNVANAGKESNGVENATLANVLEKLSFSVHLKQDSSHHQDKNGQVSNKSVSLTSDLPRDSLTIVEKDRNATVCTPSTAKVASNRATVQVLKKPTGAFGALLGNSASKRKLDIDKGKEEVKLEQIRSSVNLPFHSFSGSNEKPKTVVENPSVATESEMSDFQKPVSNPVEEIIMIDSDTDPEDTTQNNPESTNEQRETNSLVSTSGEENEDDEPMSLMELSSSFQKCFQPNSQNNRTKQSNKSAESSEFLQVKPFDYEAARQKVKFGEDPEDASLQDDEDEPSVSGRKKKNSSVKGQSSDVSNEFPQGKRRQAFPASGNRSATFR